MAEDPAERDHCRVRDLCLLESGNFSDVDVICGDVTWKCHRAILANRSVWFGKALLGHFEEASARRVKLNNQDPASVELALQHIYGGGLDVESSVSTDHFVVECVSLYCVGDFLELKSLRSSVKKAVRHYCDKRMKQLCTHGSDLSWSQDDDATELSPWALDLVLGLRGTYKRGGSRLREVLMEFIWVGKQETLNLSITPTILDHFTSEPRFVEDLISWYATGNWLQEPHWAAFGRTEIKDHWNTVALTCARCGKYMPHQTAEERKGQIDNPFKLEGNEKDEAGWCRDCGQLDMIPWRNQEANDD